MDTAQPASFPLSFEQYSVWRTARDANGWTSGCIGLELEIHGELDVAVLGLAIQDLVGRHASLRTVFERDGTRACQKVLASARVPFRIWTRAEVPVDVPNHPVDCTRFGTEDRIPFRADLFERSPTHYVLLLSTHRIVADTRSYGILGRDLALAYAARSHGNEPVWSQPEATYEDFVRWQGKALGYETHHDPSRADTFSRHLRFWRRYLDGLPERRDDSASSRSAVEAFAKLPIGLPAHVLCAARQLAVEQRVTLSMVLRAALAQSLCTLRGQDSVVLGTITDGIYRRQSSEVVGLFESSLIFRYDNVANRSFEELLQYVRSQDLEAYQRPYLPASYITALMCGCPVEEVVDAVLILHGGAPFSCPLPGLTTCATTRSIPIDRFSLVLELWSGAETAGERLPRGELSYRAHRLNRTESLAIWNGMLQTIVSAAAGAAAHTTLEAEDIWSLSPLLHENRYIAPHSSLHCMLGPIWEDILRIFPIGIRDDFFELGGNAKLAIEMARRVTATLGRSIPVPTPHEPCTIESLSEFLLATVPKVPAILIQPSQDFRPPFFYLHDDFDGGGFYVAQLSRHIDACGAIYALPPHGLNGKDSPANLEEMLRDRLLAVRSLQPHGPYYLAGHGNGGFIAYEIARRLVFMGEPVAFIGVVHAELNIVKSHSSEPYAGKVTLFWPKDEAFRTVPPTMGWGRVAQDVELHYISGNQLTSITTFAHELGSLMNRCLHAAIARHEADCPVTHEVLE
jgi:hypothetical protein